MVFFDYVYYRICKFYRGTKDTSPEFAAVCVVTLLEALNLIFLTGFCAQLVHYYFNPNKIISILILLIWLILNALHYNRINYDILNERWGYEGSKIRSMRGVLVLFYVLISIFAVITLVIWRARTK